MGDKVGPRKEWIDENVDFQWKMIMQYKNREVLIDEKFNSKIYNYSLEEIMRTVLENILNTLFKIELFGCSVV